MWYRIKNHWLRKDSILKTLLRSCKLQIIPSHVESVHLIFRLPLLLLPSILPINIVFSIRSCLLVNMFKVKQPQVSCLCSRKSLGSSEDLLHDIFVRLWSGEKKQALTFLQLHWRCLWLWEWTSFSTLTGIQKTQQCLWYYPGNHKMATLKRFYQHSSKESRSRVLGINLIMTVSHQVNSNLWQPSPWFSR